MAGRRLRSESARHIFVAVTGQTPQIVTETLYALMVERHIPISEVFVITTRVGAEHIRRDLLDPAQGQFFAFCREYGFDPRAIRFDEAHILTITRTSPRHRRTSQAVSASHGSIELDDIRTVEDNRCLAEQLLGIIQQLTDDPRTVVHGSIAGGRKTMSAYMLLAFTLYGREQDRLYHVLVPEPFEHNPQFFFPPRRERWIGVGIGPAVSTREARIDLAEIPFVRLRSWVLKEKKLRRTIEEQIRVVQRELNREAEKWETLVIDYSTRQVRFGDRLLPVRGVRLALLVYFAERRAAHPQHASGSARLQECPQCFQEYSEFDVKSYRDLCRAFASPTSGAATAKQGEPFDQDLFLSYRAKLNRALRQGGFPDELQVVNITLTRRGARYGLRLDPRRIHLVGSPQTPG
mgnify:CR=1 FL=1